MMYERPLRPDELMHYGVKGMHWGVRRYQPYPKNYTGDGREVGEARRVQDKIRNATVVDNSFKSYQNYRQIHEITDIAYKKDVRDSCKAYKKVLEDAYGTEHIKARELSNSVYLKDGKSNPKSPVVKFYKDRGSDVGPYDDEYELSAYYLEHNRDKYPDVKKKWDIADNAKKSMDQTISKYTDKLLGNLGNVKVSEIDIEGYNTPKEIANTLINDKSGEVDRQAKAALENAKKYNRYDGTFLEAVSRKFDPRGEYKEEKNMKKYGTSMIKEYEKYLDDPENYWKKDEDDIYRKILKPAKSK